MTADEITLTFPSERDFHGVLHLVVGGLAVRLDLTYDTLEDIQLALDELLARAAEDEDVTVSVRLEGDQLRTSVGPFGGEALRHELEQEPSNGGMSLRRLLETVADRVEVGKRDSGDYVELTKTVEAREAA